MAISVRCDCGWSARVADEHAGRKVRCKQCGSVVTVPVPDSEKEEDAAQYLLEDDLSRRPAAGKRDSLPRREDEDDYDRPPRDEGVADRPFRRGGDEGEADDERGRDRPSRRGRDDYDDEDDDRPRGRRRDDSNPYRLRERDLRNKDTGGGGGGGGTGTGQIVTGVLMMVGAVIWFCAGLAFDYFFFYPPILFILGIVALVKGLMSKSRQ